MVCERCLCACIYSNLCGDDCDYKVRKKNVYLSRTVLKDPLKPEGSSFCRPLGTLQIHDCWVGFCAQPSMVRLARSKHARGWHRGVPKAIMYAVGTAESRVTRVEVSGRDHVALGTFEAVGAHLQAGSETAEARHLTECH